MKKYLIWIESNRAAIFTSVYGDTPSRPFSIAGNLWNYATPGHAARRLEKLAQSWDALGIPTRRVYGTIDDMPTKGNENNVAATLAEWRKQK
jgi:hypothetical protein